MKKGAKHTCRDRPKQQKRYKTHYVQEARSKEQRKARYCFLRKCCGFPRPLALQLYAWTDSHLLQFLEANGKLRE